MGYPERAMGKIGRNEPCPCGSGRKYKRCCLPAHEAAAAERAAATTPVAGRPAPPLFAWEDDDDLDDASNHVVDLVHAGQLDEAERAARDLLARYPDVHDGLERLAMVYEARGDRKQAAEYYRKTLAFMQERADDYDPELIDWIREKAESMEQNP
jgi:tetratricopeptide (TPR) repeat protein